jgi:hypothetical protein
VPAVFVHQTNTARITCQQFMGCSPHRRIFQSEDDVSRNTARNVLLMAMDG